MNKLDIPDFGGSRTNLFEWLIENKSLLINQKKSAVKHCDGTGYRPLLYTPKGEAVKAGAIPADANKLRVVAIINTTKVMDSHDDVHLDGLWKKSLNETKDNYHVQEHDFSFKGIISTDVNAYTKNYTWQQLGVDAPGSTQALVFDSTVSKAKSPYMFDKYKDGEVKNHSVGMRYVKIGLALDDSRYPEEKALWDKHIGDILNANEATDQGYFYGVSEAKHIEGSAVPRGSNKITPTRSVSEAGKSTSVEIENEPPEGTQQTATYIFNENYF